MTKRILLLHGPNLNLLGTREPEIYGATTLAEVEGQLRQYGETMGVVLDFFQSNSEAELIDCIQTKGPESQGIIINAGGLSHTSVALRDAVATLSMPVIEVHISNVYARERFRHRSYLSGVATGVIVGLGTHGYLLALDYLAEVGIGGGRP